MRFYQFEYTLRPPGLFPEPGQEVQIANPGQPIREWFASERDAVVRRLELFKAGKLLGKKSDHEIWAVDVPTSKPDLLAWLRKECV